MSETLMDQARRALSEARNEDAQAMLINVIAREPENEEAWLLLAEAMADTGKKRECLERASAMNPRNRAILHALASFDGAPAAVAAPNPGATLLAAVADPEPASAAAALEESASLARELMLSIQPEDTHLLGAALLGRLDEAAARDAVAVRRWARSAGRDALLKYEKALTATIASLPRDDPQLEGLRAQRQRALSYLR